MSNKPIDREKILKYLDDEIKYWESHKGQCVASAIIALKDLKLEIAYEKLNVEEG